MHHTKPLPPTHPLRDDTIYRLPYKARQIEGPGLFYLGIIDYLQKYTFAKKVERFYKRFLRCYDKQGISDVPPRDYCDRFVERVIGRVGDSNLGDPQLFSEFDETAYNQQLDTAWNEQSNEPLDDSSTFVHTGRRRWGPSLSGSSTTHTLRDTPNPLSSVSAPLRNDNIRSHVHSQPVFAIDQSSSPFDSRTPAQRSRMVLRSQTLDPAPSSSAMKNGLYLSESNLPAMEAHALASECGANQSATSLLHSTSSRHSTTPQSGRSSNSTSERQGAVMPTHLEESSSSEQEKALDTIIENGTLPEMYVERDVV